MVPYIDDGELFSVHPGKSSASMVRSIKQDTRFANRAKHILNFSRLPFWSALILVLFCIALNTVALKVHFHMLHEMNDGGTFYVGAKLLGTPKLYDIKANLDMQQTYTQEHNEGLIYVRPPYVAWLWKPLSMLPYWRAQTVWRVLCAFALVATIFLFPAPRRMTLIALAISLPAVHAIIFGQDLTILLLCIAVSLLLLQRKSDLWAGIVLSLLCSKFHFLILTPIAVLWYRRFRFLAGVVIGIACEVLVSYAAQGVHWPNEYWRVLTMPKMNMFPRVMPNMLGMFSGVAHPMPWTLAGDVLVVVTLIVICRRTQSFALALTLCISGGLLTSTHAFAHDCILILPALLLLAQDEKYRSWATLLMLPFCYLAVGHWEPVIGPVLFVMPMFTLLIALALWPSRFIFHKTGLAQ